MHNYLPSSLQRVTGHGEEIQEAHLQDPVCIPCLRFAIIVKTLLT